MTFLRGKHKATHYFLDAGTLRSYVCMERGLTQKYAASLVDCYMHTREFARVKSLLCFERHGAAYFVARHYGSPTRVRVYPPTYIYEVTYDPRESIPKDYPTDDQLYAVLNEKLAYRDETFGVLV